MRFLLSLRAAIAVIALPGVVAGYVPFRLLRSTGSPLTPKPSASAFLASLLLLLGALVLLRCIWDFFASGKGTLAPIDPPVHLVVQGLYRFTRNPMYNGVLIILLAESWLFGSVILLKYALAVFLVFHLVVVLYEERTLESRFGESYRRYLRSVPRWGFRVRPFSEGTGSTA